MLTPVGKYWLKGSLLKVIDKQQDWFKGMSTVEIKEIFGEPSFDIPANEKEEHFFIYKMDFDAGVCCSSIERESQYPKLPVQVFVIKVFFNNKGLVTHMFVSDDPTF